MLGPQIGEEDAGKAAVGEVFEAALEKMFHRQANERRLVGRYAGDVLRVVLVVKIDGGQAQLSDLMNQLVACQPSNNAVGTPLREVFG